MELLEIAGGLGVGAFLGTLIFLMYRQDRKASDRRHTENLKWCADELFKEGKAIMDRLAILVDRDRETREVNTKIMTELVVMLKMINGKLSK